MTDREAMKQALEALEMHVLGFDGVRKMELAIEALEAALAQPDETETLKRCLFQMQEVAKALAQPEQEFKYTPYGLRSDENGKLSIGEISQSEWVGLTDDEIKKIVDLNTSDDGGFDIWCDGIAVAHIVCAKLKEKNV